MILVLQRLTERDIVLHINYKETDMLPKVDLISFI